MKIFYLLIISFFLLQSCGSDEEDKNAIEDFCATTPVSKIEGLSTQLQPFDSLLDSLTGTYVLEEGDISMISRAWLTESAERTIDIQYFIFSPDNVGLIALDYLLRAADRGVKIRMLIDDIMVESNTDKLVALNTHPNFSIKIYNPTANIGKNLPEKIFSLLTDFRGVNQRMHNKAFIVDGKVTITGGRNVADEYFDYDHEYNFRDRDVLLIGGVTKKIQFSFIRFWNSPLSVPLFDLIDRSNVELDVENEYNFLHQYACNPENFWPQVRERIQHIPSPSAFENIQKSGKLQWVSGIEYISDIPGKNDGTKGMEGDGITTNKLVELAKSAKHSIAIQTPYLITTKEIRKLLKSLVNKGVKIRILTNSLCSTDNLEAFNGYQRDRKELLETGVEIYEFKPDAAIRRKVMTGALQEKLDFSPVFGLHAKSMVIDEKLTVIGTFNLDPRSAHLNTECFTIIPSEEISKGVLEGMNKEFKAENAWRTTLEFNPDHKASKAKQLNMKSRRVVPKSIL